MLNLPLLRRFASGVRGCCIRRLLARACWRGCGRGLSYPFRKSGRCSRLQKSLHPLLFRKKFCRRFAKSKCLRKSYHYLGCGLPARFRRPIGLCQGNAPRTHQVCGGQSRGARKLCGCLAQGLLIGQLFRPRMALKRSFGLVACLIEGFVQSDGCLW